MSLHRGSTGSSVSQLQSILKGLNYDLGPSGVDGQFGAYTEQAVKNYQNDHGLTADGIVGPDTASSLGILLPDASGKIVAPPASGTVDNTSPLQPSGMSTGVKWAGGLAVLGGLWWAWRKYA